MTNIFIRNPNQFKREEHPHQTKVVSRNLNPKYVTILKYINLLPSNWIKQAEGLYCNQAANINRLLKNETIMAGRGAPGKKKILK